MGCKAAGQTLLDDSEDVECIGTYSEQISVLTGCDYGRPPCPAPTMFEDICLKW